MKGLTEYRIGNEAIYLGTGAAEFVHSNSKTGENSHFFGIVTSMKVLGACEYGLILYRNKLPKFNNTDETGKHRMIKNWFEFRRDSKDIPRIHPTQKPVNLLEQLIKIFTDPGDVIIDPCCGSGSTLYAARELGRSSFGFEVNKEFYGKAKEQMLGIA